MSLRGRSRSPLRPAVGTCSEGHQRRRNPREGTSHQRRRNPREGTSHQRRRNPRQGTSHQRRRNPRQGTSHQRRRNPRQGTSVLDQLKMERRCKSGSRGGQGPSEKTCILGQGQSLQNNPLPEGPCSTTAPRATILPGLRASLEDSKAVPLASSNLNLPAALDLSLELVLWQPDRFTSLYTVGGLLGRGGFGSVHEGTRRADGQKVAIKFITKRPGERYITIPGTSRFLPCEVALMLMVSEPPCSEHILQLIEWFDQPDQLILVLERPEPCVDMLEYALDQEGARLPESLAKDIMRQTVLAARHCHDHGVLHRDIKAQNLLINTDTFRVKLIDFGCGDLLKETPYRGFSGTTKYSPPEWVQDKEYLGRQATVWSLGVLLFDMVCGKLPFLTKVEIVAGQLNFKPELSQSCKDLIGWCLAPNPQDRPDLEQILQHHWCLDSSLF